MNINTVTVVGANGTMGTNVSAIFASFGNAKVYMVSRDIEQSKKAVNKAIKSVRADSITKNLIPVDYSILEKCVREADLVFESVAENIEIKQAITKQIALNLRNDAIACSGTSGLSITALAKLFPENLRGNYMGVHFYNPSYYMTLCEVIPTPYTNKTLFDEMKSYLANTLFRTVVESKDSPAFIGNRIGFHFINKALQLAEKYKESGGIDYIDAILGAFTGRAMPPLVTSDFVGLDVHKAIVDNIRENTNDYANDIFSFPVFCQELIDKGSLGRKSGGGLYKTQVLDNGTKRYMVYDIHSADYRDTIKYSFPFVEQMVYALSQGDYKSALKALLENHSTEAEICVEFMLEYIIYSLFISLEVGNGIDSADGVMATGFNWCPPLAMLEAFSNVVPVESLIKERLSASLLEKVGADRLLSCIKSSAYDYRSYFKAKK
ncbi:MAG: 3-hydroxyacyl-CoA dehydrogenase family protein [Defluviitaleaceae bacterium]|nr:3-hydroxyacyl-CoA dehydrogenase family protein [Defluviitaleaceae bacterium]